MNPAQAIDRMRQVIRREYKALSTEQSYVYWLRRYMGALQAMPASLTSEQKLERFLTHLAREQDVADSTQNQAFNALVYCYKEVLGKPLERVEALRAKRPAHLRHAPSVQDTRALLQAVSDRAAPWTLPRRHFEWALLPEKGPSRNSEFASMKRHPTDSPTNCSGSASLPAYKQHAGQTLVLTGTPPGQAQVSAAVLPVPRSPAPAAPP